MKIENISKRSAGTTRRGFLQGLGAAMAGVGIASAATRPAPKPFTASLKLGDELTPAFDAQLVDANGNPMTALAPGTYQSGMMFFRTTGTDGNGNPYNDVQFVDVQDQTSAFSLLDFFTTGELPKTPFAPPVLNATTLYTATGSNIYEIDVNGNSEITWAPVSGTIASNLLLLGQNLIFATSDGNVWICSITTRSGSSIASGVSGSTISLTTANNILYIQGGSGLSAINLTTKTLVFTAQPSISGTLTIGSGSLLVGGDTSVAAYDPSTGSSLWTYPSSGSLTGPISAPIYSNHQVYVADAAGILHAINAESGVQTIQYTVGDGGAVGSLFLEDGVVYVSYNEASSMVIYALELDNQNTTSYSTNSVGTFLGLENGLVCFTHLMGKNVAGVNMTGVLHGFTSDSTLIEDYVPDGTGAAPHNSSYHTVVTLLDPNYNPRANKAVKVWASDSVLLVVNDVQYNIDSETSIWLNTDTAGQLTLVVTELDNSAANVPMTVHCPALYMWGTFMETGEAIVIYPDHVTVNKLATTQGQDLSTAQDFNGNKFTVGSGADDLASSLRNTIGGVNQSLELLRTRNTAHMTQLTATRSRRTGHVPSKPVLRDDPNKYKAYPDSNPNMFYFGDAANQDPERPYAIATGQVPNWQLDLTDPSAPTFTPLANALDASQLGGIHISWKDLESKIVHGVENVVKVVASTVANVVTHIITTAENVYHLVVDSIEAAAAAVGSILKTIAKAIKSAVQWLSYLFAWDDIKATKRFIVNQVTTQATAFNTWLTNKVAAGTTDIHNYFQGEISAIKGHVQSIAGQQPATMQSQQINNNDPSSTYGHGGGSSSAQTNWMSSKIKGNVGKGTNTSTSTLQDSPDLDSTIQGLFDSVKTSLQDPIFATFGDDVKTLLNTFADIIKDPTEFVKGGMGAILNIFADIVGIILTLVDDVVEDLLKAIPVLVNAALNAVTAPINIPILSEIWDLISGDPMTILDVFALVIAIPSTIISKIVNGVNSTANTSVGGASSILGYTQVFAGAIYAIFDAINDGINFTDFSPEAKIGLAMSVITFFLGFPSDIATNSGFTYGFYALAALPIVTASISGRGNSYVGDAPPWVKIWGIFQRFFNFLYGAMMIAFSSALAAEIPANWSGLTLAQNLFTYVVYMPKAFAVGPTGCPARLVAAVVDGVCDLTAAGLEGAITWGA